MAYDHLCATCGLPDLGGAANEREGRVLCATCGLALHDSTLAGPVSEPATLQGPPPEPARPRPQPIPRPVVPR